jgi:hypothetical protein
LRDATLVAWVEAIERHLGRLRGRDHALSPRDFALARSWHAAGVPLGTVLNVLDEAAASTGEVTSLAYHRARIERLSGVRAAPAARGAASSTEALLQELHEGLLRLPTGALERVRRRVAEVLDLLAVGSRPNWDYVKGALTEIDDAVSARVVECLTPEQRDVIELEAASLAEPGSGRASAERTNARRRRLVVLRAREVLGLPRVGGE